MTTSAAPPKQQEGKTPKKPASTTLTLNDFRKDATPTTRTASNPQRHEDYTWALDSNNHVDPAEKKEHENQVADHRRNVSTAAHSASSKSFAFRSGELVGSAAGGQLPTPPTTAPYIAFLKSLPTNAASESLSSHLHTKVGIRPKRVRVIIKGVAAMAFVELDTYNDLCLLLSLRTIGYGGRIIPILVANESQRSGADRLFDPNVGGADGGDAAERSWSELSISTPGSAAPSVSASFASPAYNGTPPPAPSTPKVTSNTPTASGKPIWRPRGASGAGGLSRDLMGNEAPRTPASTVPVIAAKPSEDAPAPQSNQSAGTPTTTPRAGAKTSLSVAPLGKIASGDSSRHRAYIGNLSLTVTEAEVTGFFFDIGVEVKNVSPLQTDKHGGSAFTFVDFGDAEQLKHILHQNGKQMLGRPMTITLPKNPSIPPPPPPPPTATNTLAAPPSRQSLAGLDRNRFGAFVERKDSALSTASSHGATSCEPSYQARVPNMNRSSFPPSPSLGAHPITTLHRTDSCETLSSFGGTSSVSIAPTPAVTPGGDSRTANNGQSAHATPPPKLMLSDPAPPMHRSPPTTIRPAPPITAKSNVPPPPPPPPPTYGPHAINSASPCVFIGNLPAGTTDSALMAHFASNFGLKIEALRMKMRGKSNYAFADFATDADATNAIAHHDWLFGGRPMRILLHDEKGSGGHGGDVEGVAPKRNTAPRDAAATTAPVQPQPPRQHPHQKTAPRDTAATTAHAQPPQQHPHQTHRNTATAAAAGSANAPSVIKDFYRVYIGNLPTGTTEKALQTYFSETLSVSVLSARIRTKGPTTFAFMDLSSEKDQARAITFDSATFCGRPMRIVATVDVR